VRIFHTPGHTSGCISIIETTHGLLFSADSVFAGGTLSYIAESGSIVETDGGPEIFYQKSDEY
jgi:glyoxylase-like metal-dependent hydrolase (beta-lactamase superfamily II)